ncbi:hypothetical protein CMESO_525 (nucleomorph) [Chroomonas mesostigmatica CCMP1168]|uniref:E3 ubiquitin protein ligase n=1 Tax=Chroomonas mesostigmatica CCMP1168 TaxID=1195612 RepID=J7G3M8_9CRYP|nr:hypothetical protein CMESO_525 [Chroomonas mesostigmatica CCMP1168]
MNEKKKKNFQIYFPNLTVEKISSQFFLFICNKFTRFYFDQSTFISFVSKDFKKKEKIIDQYLVALQYIFFLIYHITTIFHKKKKIIKNDHFFLFKIKKKFKKRRTSFLIKKKMIFDIFFGIFSNFLIFKFKILKDKSQFLSFFFKNLTPVRTQKKNFFINNKKIYPIKNENLIYYNSIFKLFNQFKIDSKNDKTKKKEFLGKSVPNIKPFNGPEKIFFEKIQTKEIEYLEKISLKRLERIKTFYCKSDELVKKKRLYFKNKLNYFKRLIYNLIFVSKKTYSVFTTKKNNFIPDISLFFFKKKKKKILNINFFSMKKTKHLILRGEERKKKNSIMSSFEKNFELFLSNFLFFFFKFIQFFLFYFILLFLEEGEKKKIKKKKVICFLQTKKFRENRFFSNHYLSLENKKNLLLFQNKDKVFRLTIEILLEIIKKNFCSKKLFIYFFYNVKKINDKIFLKKKFIFLLESYSKIVQAFKLFNLILEICFYKDQQNLKNCFEKMKNSMKIFLTLEKLVKHQSWIIGKKNIKKKNQETKKSFISDTKKTALLLKFEEKIRKLRENLKCNDLSQKNKIIEILFKKINCPINIFLPKNVVIVNCGHLFSSACIKDLITSRNRKCPLCGKNFGKEGIRSIFLN